MARKNYGKSVKTRLLNLMNETGYKYMYLLARYFNERLLYRVSVSQYKDNFLLKGGSLLYAMDGLNARPTLLTDGVTKINGTLDDAVVRQSGNPLADDMNMMEEDWLRLKKEKTDIMSSGEPIDTTALIAREDSFVVNILKAHPNDQVGVICALEYADGICCQFPRRGIELIDMLDAAVIAKEPKLRMKKKDLQTLLETDKGSMFRDFTVEYDGTQQRLSDYVGCGKYVLVDFWASWCGTCREEMPNIVAAYKKYKSRGLQVVGIACLEDAKSSIKYVREQNIPYPQIFNAGMSVLQLYGMDGIPYMFLFAPDGTILARGLRGNEIEQKLEEIFNDK